MNRSFSLNPVCFDFIRISEYFHEIGVRNFVVLPYAVYASSTGAGQSANLHMAPLRFRCSLMQFNSDFK